MAMTRRNFSIIAHIDHGKSTLAGQFLKHTHAVEERKDALPLFDTMELERERGVTIKLKPVRFVFNGVELNLIDTPGHVDFSYEVSRSLAAVEGALLVVDAAKGIQAQTLAHYHVAQQLGLVVLPVVNKIDLPNANVKSVRQQLRDLTGCGEEDVLCVSAKTGQGIRELLDAIVARIPEPPGDPASNPRALVFDAVFDDYRGVIAYARVVDGSFRAGERLAFQATRARADILEVGTFQPAYAPAASLGAGEIGYIVTGLKELAACRVGDTLAQEGRAVTPLPGYREPQSMVYASLYPLEGQDATSLRRALEKLKLNDAALQFEGERSAALGLGFRCGFLGLFHLEIVQERLRREYGQALVVTVPSVAYRVVRTNGEQEIVRTAQEFPDPSAIRTVEEPWVELRCVLPSAYIGTVMQVVQERRGAVRTTEYLGGSGSGERMMVLCDMPLANVITNFYDIIKSRTSGFASLFYEFAGFREADIVRVDILLAGERAEALSTLVVHSDAERVGRAICVALQRSIPPEQFEIRIQAALGGRIIASERIAPLRKDVTAKLYGGDVTRKRKLLEKQKKGKKRMRERGRVTVPPEAYLAVVKKDSPGVQ